MVSLLLLEVLSRLGGGLKSDALSEVLKASKGLEPIIKESLAASKASEAMKGIESSAALKAIMESSVMKGIESSAANGYAFDYGCAFDDVLKAQENLKASLGGAFSETVKGIESVSGYNPYWPR